MTIETEFAPTQFRTGIRRLLRGIALPVLLLLAWEVASRTGLVDPRILPLPERIAVTAVRQTVQGSLLIDLGWSLSRDVSGFVIGSLAGLAFGAALARFLLLGRLLRPSFDMVKQIAIFAWIPLIAMWFGNGETAKIVFIALAAFTPVALNTYEGVSGAPHHLVEVGRLLRLRPRQFWLHLYLPAALPSILTGVHLALVFSWLATIGAEYFLNAGPGIGSLIIEGRDTFAMNLVILGVILLGVVGFTLNAVAEHAERMLVRWRRA
jgi:sulfonate transport system permease protein